MLKQLTPLQQAWVTALRSGKYKQAKHRLQREDGYCCLGVLCEVAKDFGYTPTETEDSKLSGTDLDDQVGSSFMVGLKSSYGKLCRTDGFSVDFLQNMKSSTSLTQANDSFNATFEELADIIEWNADILFE